MSNDRDDDVGYGKPPKKSQFKKGQSGCPNGGHAQRKANKMKKAKDAETKAKRAEKELKNVLRDVFSRERAVRTAAGETTMPSLQIVVENLVSRSVKPDASNRDVSLVLKLAEKGKFLEPAPAETGKTMVLVVNSIKTPEQWAKDTEGELLPKNPLEGIPGMENALDAPLKRGRVSFDGEEY